MGRGGERAAERERERNKKCRQCPFIMLMQCMYQRRRFRKVCVCGLGVRECVSLMKDLQGPMRAFESA